MRNKIHEQPDHVKNFLRMKNTEIKCVKGKYWYLYEYIYIDVGSGRKVKKTVRCLGSITEQGLIFSKKINKNEREKIEKILNLSQFVSEDKSINTENKNVEEEITEVKKYQDYKSKSKLDIQSKNVNLSVKIDNNTLVNIKANNPNDFYVEIGKKNISDIDDKLIIECSSGLLRGQNLEEEVDSTSCKVTKDFEHLNSECSSSSNLNDEISGKDFSNCQESTASTAEKDSSNNKDLDENSSGCEGNSNNNEPDLSKNENSTSNSSNNENDDVLTSDRNMTNSAGDHDPQMASSSCENLIGANEQSDLAGDNDTIEKMSNSSEFTKDNIKSDLERDTDSKETDRSREESCADKKQFDLDNEGGLKKESSGCEVTSSDKVKSEFFDEKHSDECQTGLAELDNTAYESDSTCDVYKNKSSETKEEILINNNLNFKNISKESEKFNNYDKEISTKNSQNFNKQYANKVDLDSHDCKNIKKTSLDIKNISTKKLENNDTTQKDIEKGELIYNNLKVSSKDSDDIDKINPKEISSKFIDYRIKNIEKDVDNSGIKKQTQDVHQRDFSDSQRYDSEKYHDNKNKFTKKIIINSNTSICSPIISDTHEFGLTAYYYMNTRELRTKLEKCFPDIWKEIYLFGFLFGTYSSVMKRLNKHYENSFFSELIPYINMNPSNLSDFFYKIGKQRSKILEYMKYDLEGNSLYIWDCHRLITDSNRLQLAELGYDSKERHKKQINLINLFAVGENFQKSIYYKILSGGTVDEDCLKSALEEISILPSNVINITDKGFSSFAIYNKLKVSGQYSVIPVKRNCSSISMLIPTSIDSYDSSFLYRGRPIFYKILKSDYLYIVYLDLSLYYSETLSIIEKTEKVNEKSKLDSSKRGISYIKDIDNVELLEASMKNLRLKDSRGTISFRIVSDGISLDNNMLSPKQIYFLWKKRSSIEQYYDTFDTTLDLKNINVQNEFTLEGTFFIKHFASIFTMQILDKINIKNYTKTISFEDVITELKYIYTSWNGFKWILNPIKEKTKKFLDKIGFDSNLFQKFLNIFNTNQ